MMNHFFRNAFIFRRSHGIVITLASLVLWGTAVLIITASPASARPIVFDAPYLRSLIGQQISGTVFPMTDVSSIEPLTNLTGDSKIFDFRPYSYGESVTVISQFRVPSSDVPGAQDPNFTGADYVLITSTNTDATEPAGTSYHYHKLENEGLFLLGYVVVGDFDQDGKQDQSIAKVSSSNPARQGQLLFKLPLTAGTQWNFSYEILMRSVLSTVGEQQIMISVSGDAAVEGWGPLITPEGQAACLRFRTSSQSSIDISGEIPIPPTNLTLIQFLTKSNVSANIGLDGTGTVLFANHEVHQVSPATTTIP